MTRLALIGLLLVGCTIEDIDISGRDCLEGQCPDGYACDMSGGPPGRCFARTDMRDAGRSDAGPLEDFDAGRRLDSGPPPTDGGGPDGGVGNGCVDPRHIFCEDFETGNTSRWLPRLAGGSTVDVSEVAARSGRYSVRATSNPLPEPDTGGYTGMIYVEAFEGMSVTDRWVRAHYLFPAGAGTETSILDLGNALFEAGVIVDVDSYTEASWFSSFDDGMVFHEGIGVSIATDTWVCVELHVVTGATDGRVELYVDSSLVSSRIGVDSRDADSFQNVAVGSWHFAPSGVRIVYVDDVIVSTVRPGCD